jgi:alpha-tubulin suppressor-like RCC1 family protein
MWGSDAQKQLGNADGAAYDAYQEIPTKVLSLGAAVKGVRIACGHKHTALLDKDGNVWVWGNVGGFLPKKITPPTGKKVVEIASGAGTVFAVTAGGEVFSFTTTKITDILRTPVPLGHDQATHNEPVLLSALQQKGKTVAVSAGLHHAVAVVAK